MSETATLPLPAPTASPHAAARPSRWGPRVDVLLIATTLAFAFLSGSFIARNSDIWLHLATGRLLATGQFTFGVEPFTYTAAGHYWANPAWLSDLGLFLLYRAAGGGALVILKAALVGATAAVMFWTVGRRSPVWLTAGSLLLAILAMTPRLLLQPTVISYLVLATCLYCLKAGGRALVAVPILIALWVNLDGWFILGPILIGLFWLGRQIDPQRPLLATWPRWLMPASVLACFLSPYHVFALSLPAEISPAVWMSGLPNDPRLAGVFVSPWHLGALGAAAGYPLAVWAFLVLLALGIISFALNPRALPTWRGLVWVSFAALAAWQARLIPFFAVVAGPVTALNLGELVPRSAYRRSGRALLLLTSVALIGLAWLGWTMGFRNRDRGAGWAIHTDPTLERAAIGLAEFRELQHLSVDEHVFIPSADLGHYVAWFAPGEKATIDSRLQLFTAMKGNHDALSRAVGLLPEAGPDHETASELLAKHRVVAVALYDADAGRLRAAIHVVFSGKHGSWSIARIDGGSLLIAPSGSPAAATSFDSNAAAFGQQGQEIVPAADNGPLALAEPAAFWRIKPRRGRQGSWEADAAPVFLALFEERARLVEERFPRVPFFGLWIAGETVRLSRTPARSPALPLLAIRSARRGIESDPRDANAWLALGRAYLTVSEQTWEQEAGRQLTLLRQLRQIQTATAFVQAALLNPDSPAIRQTLAHLYSSMGAFDLAYRHASEGLRLARRQGPAPGEPGDSFDQRLAHASEFVQSIEGVLRDNENRFVVRTTGLVGEPLAQARIANELGLPQKAIDILVHSHPDLYGAEGLKLLIQLLLATGQSQEARVLLDRDELRRRPAFLGPFNLPGVLHPGGERWAYQLPAYPWFNLCQYAGSGRYDLAQTSIDVLYDVLASEETLVGPRLPMELGYALIRAHGDLGAIGKSLTQFVMFWSEVTVHPVQRGDLATLAGLLALERGQLGVAKERFSLAQKLYEDPQVSAFSKPGFPLSKRYLDMIRSKR